MTDGCQRQIFISSGTTRLAQRPIVVNPSVVAARFDLGVQILFVKNVLIDRGAKPIPRRHLRGLTVTITAMPHLCFLNPWPKRFRAFQVFFFLEYLSIIIVSLVTPDFYLNTGDDPAHDVWHQTPHLNMEAVKQVRVSGGLLDCF